jgi:Tfp pilus assembly protein PilN
MKKSAQIKINLIPKDPFFSTATGRILRWALSAGRYIVIFTELIVIISFATRFTLDRQVTDLNSSIEQKRQVILSYGDLEDRFRTVQGKINHFKQIEQETNLTDSFLHLSEVVPSGVILSELSIRPASVSISGVAESQRDFNFLINNLQISPNFFNINVSEVSSDERSSGLEFRIVAETRAISVQSPDVVQGL